MQPPPQRSWIKLVDIKSRLNKKLGLERFKQYLDYLNRFLSLKLDKAEFDKLCLRTLGKDNIQLHNQLICSVLKNSCIRASHGINGDPLKTDKARNGDGDVLPPSPHKARNGARDRRVGDRKSALRPNGATKFTSLLSPISQTDDICDVLENGDLSSPNHQEIMQLAKKGQTKSLDKKDEKHETGNSCKFVGELHIDGLLDTTTLKERMEQITSVHGHQQVSLDCANVMNRGLDEYLKGLIRSCTQLHEVRSIHEPTTSGPIKYPTHIYSNGVRQSGGWPLNVMQAHEPEHKCVVTLLDFRVAMELNCKQLGEDGLIHLEKICTHSFEK